MNGMRWVLLSSLLAWLPSTTLADVNNCFCLMSADFSVVRKSCFVQQKGIRIETRCRDQNGAEYPVPDLTGWIAIQDGKSGCTPCRPAPKTGIRKDIRGGNDSQNQTSSQDSADEPTE